MEKPGGSVEGHATQAFIQDHNKKKNRLWLSHGLLMLIVWIPTSYQDKNPLDKPWLLKFFQHWGKADPFEQDFHFYSHAVKPKSTPLWDKICPWIVLSLCLWPISYPFATLLQSWPWGRIVRWHGEGRVVTSAVWTELALRWYLSA